MVIFRVFITGLIFLYHGKKRRIKGKYIKETKGDVK